MDCTWILTLLYSLSLSSSPLKDMQDHVAFIITVPTTLAIFLAIFIMVCIESVFKKLLRLFSLLIWGCLVAMGYLFMFFGGIICPWDQVRGGSEQPSGAPGSGSSKSELYDESAPLALLGFSLFWCLPFYFALWNFLFQLCVRFLHCLHSFPPSVCSSPPTAPPPPPISISLCSL